MGDCHVRDVSLSRGGVDPSLRGEWKRAAATDIARDCLTGGVDGVDGESE